jgi:anti-sigma regulatory factor (Ser/Thr protein kinase)
VDLSIGLTEILTNATRYANGTATIGTWPRGVRLDP